MTNACTCCASSSGAVEALDRPDKATARDSLVSQIVEQTRRTLAVYPDRTSATFEVQPPELGRVSIAIALSSDNSARTLIQAHTAQGREALLANAGQLRAEFDRQGLPPSQLSFAALGAGAQGGSAYMAYEQRQAQRWLRGSDQPAAQPAAPAARGARPAVSMAAATVVRYAGGGISVTV